MKQSLLFSSLFTGTMLASAIASAQADRFAYAITDVSKEGYNWSVLRKLDLQSAAYSDVLLSGGDMNAALYDAGTKKQLAPQTDALYGRLANAPFGTGVAALAYDKKNERLWFTPMLIDQLRYVDLKTMQVYAAPSTPLTGSKQKAADQSDIITRMVIGSDGNGYALSNDGKNFIRFSATKKGMQVTNLGSLTNAPENKEVSVFNACTSYGGDIIADDDGSLYILSARNHVFKVDIESKVATHLGIVSGLPATFTMNGAAVTEDNKVIITSATDNSSVYQLDIKSLAATPVQSTVIPWRTSDLANSNLFRSGKYDFGTPDVKQIVSADAGLVDIYPNPVRGKQFAVQFKKLSAGNYTIQVLDGNGKQLTQSIVNISGKGQVESINLPGIMTTGIYLVKVIDHNKKAVYTDKLVVQ